MINDKSIIFLIGLPGSGKSMRMNGRNKYEKIQATATATYCFFDDFYQTSSLEKLKNEIINGNSFYIAISDFSFIYPEILMKAVEFVVSCGAGNICFEVWENNPEQCIKNNRARKDGRIISDKTIKDASAKFVWPLSNTYSRNDIDGCHIIEPSVFNAKFNIGDNVIIKNRMCYVMEHPVFNAKFNIGDKLITKNGKVDTIVDTYQSRNTIEYLSSSSDRYIPEKNIIKYECEEQLLQFKMEL
jgi:hypothetical protein